MPKTTFQDRALRTQATTINDLLIDPIGNAENELRSLFARPAQRSQATDSITTRCIAASKPPVQRDYFDRRGTDKWLDKSKPRT